MLARMAKGCIYCGNNKVHHFSAWLQSTVSLILAPKDPAARFHRIAAYAGHQVFRVTLFVFRLLGFARLREAESMRLSGRGKVLAEEAARRRIVLHNYELFGRPTEAFRAVVAGKAVDFVALPRPIATRTGSEHWLDDKWLLKQRLIDAGMPVPRGTVCTTLKEAEAAFAALNRPVVVKPRVGSRGRHTTTHVGTLEELRAAFARAKQLCRWVVVEEHLEGAVYRATLIGGQLVGVLAGEPPRVVGDGTSPIAVLVEKKNAARHKKVSPVVLGEQHRAFLSRLGKTVDTIPMRGEIVDLLEKIGVSYGGHSAEVTPVTHLETKRILKAAAEVVDDPMIGFDFIIPDIVRSPHGQHHRVQFQSFYQSAPRPGGGRACACGRCGVGLRGK